MNLLDFFWLNRFLYFGLLRKQISARRFLISRFLYAGFYCIPLGQALIASTQLPVKRTKAADIESGTFSLFGLMHLIKCGLAAVILSMRIPKDVLYVKKITIVTTDFF